MQTVNITEEYPLIIPTISLLNVKFILVSLGDDSSFNSITKINIDHWRVLLLSYEYHVGVSHLVDNSHAHRTRICQVAVRPLIEYVACGHEDGNNKWATHLFMMFRGLAAFLPYQMLLLTPWRFRRLTVHQYAGCSSCTNH